MAGAKMWLRIRPLNVTSADQMHINITDDATPDGSRVGTSGWISGATVTGLGGGWFEFSGVYDATGDADRSGALMFYMSTANNAIGVLNNAVYSNQVAVHALTFEQL